MCLRRLPSTYSVPPENTAGREKPSVEPTEEALMPSRPHLSMSIRYMSDPFRHSTGHGSGQLN